MGKHHGGVQAQCDGGQLQRLRGSQRNTRMAAITGTRPIGQLQ